MEKKRNQDIVMQERGINQEQLSPRKNGLIDGRKSLIKRKVSWSERNLGQYIHQRMKEENLTRDDLDESTINFFFQQFKTQDCTGHSEWSERYQRNIWVKDDE